MDNYELIKELLLFGIYSTTTGVPYLSENMEAYYFENKAAGLNFTELIPNTTVCGDPIDINYKTLKELYIMGVDTIIVKKANGDLVKYQLDPSRYESLNTNRSLVSTLILLKQTQKKKYLRELCKCYFYKPILIDKRRAKKYQGIHYCKAINGTLKTNLLFATVDDFNSWNKRQEQNWNAIKISCKEIIRDNNGENYNIYKYIILTRQMIEVIKETPKEDYGKHKQQPEQQSDRGDSNNQSRN